MPRLCFCFFVLTMFAMTACNETPNVKNFKNGRFKSVMPGIGTDIINRQGNSQTERFNTKPEATFTVKWLDDVTYTLTPSEEFRVAHKLPINAVMTVKITKTTDTSYFCTTKLNISDVQINSEFIKLD